MCMSRLAQSIVATGLVMKSTVAGLPCDVDVQCQNGYYCASSICLRCYNCTRYFMQAAGACSKSITECGSCLPGYVPADNKLEGCTTPKSSTLPYWPALLAAAVAVILFFGFLARYILTRKRNTDIVHARPALNGDDKANPTAPPPEEYTRLNPPTHLEGCRNGYQPTANGNTLETQEDSALLVTTGVSPPPYSTVINEIRASAHPVAPAVRTTDDITVPGHPSQNDLNSTQHNSHGLRDVTGNNPDDTNYISGPSDNVPRLPRQSAIAPNDRPSIHPRTQKGHPKDTRVSRVNETRQRARKFNEPNYDNNEIPENTPASGGQNEALEWLQDEDTMESGWSPHASSATAAPSAATAADTTAPSFNISQFHGPDAATEPVRVTTRARTDDDGPPRTRRRLATDNNRVAEVGERTLVIRSPAGAGAAQSPPVSGDDLTPEDGARRPLYSYNVINIQPELSIIAKIK